MAVLNNLFPPVLDTYMPAFSLKSEEGCRVYFSLSSYNNIDDIYEAQITVNNQFTNKSVLNNSIYSNNIKLDFIQTDTSRKSDDKYYIVIYSSDLVQGFQQNEYYKVQIRFTSKNADDLDITQVERQKDSKWFNNNLDYFSEWSKVCLIRGIVPPSINMKNFVEGSGYGTVFSTPFITFFGSVIFSEGEKETLKSYQIKLFDSNNDLIVNTNEIYTSGYYNTNEINYTFKNEFQDNEKYRIELIITTQNSFSSTHYFNFSIKLAATDPLTLQTEIKMDETNARIKISLKTTKPFSKNIIIKRTSSLSNFNLWEDVHIYPFKTTTEKEYIWYDYTIESGVWYKYAIQKGDSKGNRGTATILNEEPLMIVFNDIFLTTADKQLKIKFDPSIGSLKYTVAESKTDTIGSKYPFIRKNGDIYYRQLPLSGLISFLSDESELFISEEEMYGNSKDYYNKYNLTNRVTSYNDFVKEKMFRDKVMEFLHQSTVKLFRSATEGNILVKLMDISFTPETSLGRYLYKFSCTAYEIDEISIDNFNKYDIQKLGTFDSEEESSGEIVITYPVFGQHVLSVENSTGNLIPIIQNKYPTTPGYKGSIQSFSFLHIEIDTQTSPPYPIVEQNGILSQATNNEEDSFLGYILNINGQSIAVNSDGYYELENEEGLTITSLFFPIGVVGVLDYVFEMGEFSTGTSTETETSTPTAVAAVYLKGIGQLPVDTAFECEESVYNIIAEKYLQEDSSITQRLISIDGLQITAAPGTVVYIKMNNDSAAIKYKIGLTSDLRLYDENIIIKDFYFNGLFIEEDISMDLLLEENGTLYYIYQNEKYEAKAYKIDNSSNYELLTGSLVSIKNSIEAIEIFAPVTALVEYKYQLERVTE